MKWLVLWGNVRLFVIQRANQTDTTRSCQRATRRTNVLSWLKTDQTTAKGGDVQIVVYSRQLSQLEQIIVHFALCWPTLRLATSPFTLSRWAAISAPRRATCSGVRRRQPMRSRCARVNARDTERKRRDKMICDCGPHMTWLTQWWNMGEPR